MSTSLYWRPLPKEPEKTSIGSLKYILREELGEVVNATLETTVVDADLIPFLRGVVIATEDEGVKECAEQLITAIETHGSVELFEQS